MDSDTVIRATGLGKSYVIGHKSAERHDTLRDTLARAARNFARMGHAALRNRPMVEGDTTEEFWALSDVDFEIRRGEVVGVIGRNGAGKSTLLKVLSRITEPTTGRVEIRGRVASLLEVGTGFHPELSGRENIFLNGAILGMSRAEIRRKFDEIVAFSEVERFLDTPVKRYSSGMYVRLAFAVAAHLEPEILIVDEVLAVGDAEFQKKCLGKMQDVAGHGRTVLFVSHNIGMIGQLCTSGIHLSGGRVVQRGPIRDCIASLFSREEHGSVYDFDRQGEKPSITRFEFDEQELRSGVLKAKIDVKMAAEDSGNLYLGLILKSSTGVPVWGSSSQIHGNIRQGRMASGTFECVTPTLPLSAGQYLLSIWLTNDNGVLDTRIDALSLFLEHHPLQAGRPGGDVMGFMELPAQWSFCSETVEVTT